MPEMKPNQVICMAVRTDREKIFIETRVNRILYLVACLQRLTDEGQLWARQEQRQGLCLAMLEASSLVLEIAEHLLRLRRKCLGKADNYGGELNQLAKLALIPSVLAERLQNLLQLWRYYSCYCDTDTLNTIKYQIHQGFNDLLEFVNWIRPLKAAAGKNSYLLPQRQKTV